MQDGLQMSAITRRKKIGLAKTEAVKRKHPFRHRKPSAIIFFHAIDVAAHYPVAPGTGPDKRKTVDELKVGVPVSDAILGQFRHQPGLVEAGQCLIEA